MIYFKITVHKIIPSKDSKYSFFILVIKLSKFNTDLIYYIILHRFFHNFYLQEMLIFIYTFERVVSFQTERKDITKIKQHSTISHSLKSSFLTVLFCFFHLSYWFSGNFVYPKTVKVKQESFWEWNLVLTNQVWTIWSDCSCYCLVKSILCYCCNIHKWTYERVNIRFIVPCTLITIKPAANMKDNFNPFMLGTE
jgi:hypothetical protein